MSPEDFANVEFVIGNSNKRFSGVTSTMLQVLPLISQKGKTVVLGKHHLPDGVPHISFLQAIRLLRVPSVKNNKRLFHARRNDEMIQALILKYLFRAKIKIVFTSTAQRKKTWLTRWLMRRMDGLLSTCDAAAQYMPSTPDEIIPHGIDTEVFAAPSKEPSNLKLPSKNNIGLFGRVRPQKGVDLLVQAALEILPEFQDWGVVVVGEITPQYESFVKEQSRVLVDEGLGGRFIFTGELPFEQVPKYFQSVDVVCALSTNEGFGLTVLEGGAAGKPIVATKAGAWPDILGKQNIGYLIEVGDLDGLTHALKILMKSARLRETLGANAASLISKDYSVETEATRLASYYRSVLSH